MKLRCIMLIFVCISCADSKNESLYDTAYEEALLANSNAIYQTKAEVVVPSIYPHPGDTFLIDHSMNFYLFGEDSMKGRIGPVLVNSIVRYVYQYKNDLVFDVYDSLGSYIDRGSIRKLSFEKAVLADIDARKIDFYNLLMRKLEKSNDSIAKKIGISIDQLDSIVYERLN